MKFYKMALALLIIFFSSQSLTLMNLNTSEKSDKPGYQVRDTSSQRVMMWSEEEVDEDGDKK